LIDPVDPNELVAGAMAPKDGHARGTDAEPICQQLTNGLISATIKRRRSNAYY
jgi:hypothetical protein